MCERERNRGKCDNYSLLTKFRWLRATIHQNNWVMLLINKVHFKTMFTDKPIKSSPTRMYTHGSFVQFTHSWTNLLSVVVLELYFQKSILST